jgi:amidase
MKDLKRGREKTFDLTRFDAKTLSAGIARGQISCAELMEQTLDRIEMVNPSINAIVSLRPRGELMGEARLADEQQPKGLFHGLPFAIKDLVETKDLRTTHGSPIFANHIPLKDDLLASRIRASGAIIIGKTNAPEFGLGSQSYNPVHGVTRNPYDLTKTAGGSSGGAAAALAARLVAVSDGSDTMGSLRNPAAFCNVYGLRPSYGLVPSDLNGETFLHQLSTDGPMARTVDDLAMLLDVISGPEAWYPHSMQKQESFAKRLENPSGPCRLGWIGDWNAWYPLEKGILELCEGALSDLENCDHTVEPVIPGFSPSSLWNAWMTLRSFSISASLGAHYDKPDQRKFLKPEAIFEIENGRSLSKQDIINASLTRSQWFAAMADLFELFDAVILPSAQVFPFDADLHWPIRINDKKMKTYHNWMEIVIPASLVGLPAINVPVGFSSTGLPMGMQIVGSRGSDLKLLQIAQSYHQATDWPDKLPARI